ncbi:hypothetical protein [Dyadobacter sp. CY343]|uniref:hypothetical protein n=1 Tax=Dyadobacter sp. CY343 TaxID=2907299 RepID=UPI001F1E0557|nr:hypothetical protein [Dyadobacter sp. CY343]MCE7063468.1 hypothetical protein [Dyadobacter sp. CY343]
MNSTYTKIESEPEYNRIMEEILVLMNKGEVNLSEAEMQKIRKMALAAEAYEREHYYIEPPKALQGMV